MIKLIIILLGCLTIFPDAQSQGEEFVTTGRLWGSALYNYPQKLKGRVKEIRYDNFWGREENGKILRTERRDTKTNPAFIEQYNSYGATVSAAWLNDSGGISRDFWSIRVVAEGKRIVKSSYYLFDTLRFYTRNIYSGEDLTDIMFLNPVNDTVVMKIVYEYDKHGNRTGWREMTGMDVLIRYAEFGYNSSDNIEKIKLYSAKGELTFSEDIIYNRKGEWTGSRAANLLSGIRYNHENEYEYDSTGNWIKRINYQSPNTIKLIFRKIEYY